MKFLISATFPNNVRLCNALSSIKGLGNSTSLQICEELGISPWLPLKVCTSRHLDNVTALVLENFRINDDLQEQKRQARKRIQFISAYRSFRYASGLPCRGQRTRSNAMTCRRLSISEKRITRQTPFRRNKAGQRRS